MELGAVTSHPAEDLEAAGITPAETSMLTEHGPPGGQDEVLVTLAQRLTEVCREQDLVARLVGDEFILVAFELSSAVQADEVAKKIVDGVAQPMASDGAEICVRTSVGFTTALRPSR